MASPLPDLPDVPAELSIAGAEGHLVVLVGAGASRGAGLPSWDGLLINLLDLAIREAPDLVQRAELESARASWGDPKAGWDPLTKASVLGQALGEARLRDAIAAEMHVPGAAPTPTHLALATLLPSAAFLTTNYDQLLEVAIDAHTGRKPKVVLLDDLEGLRDFRAGQVLKLHGDVDAPHTIVLRGEDYFRVGHRAPKAWKERLKVLLQPPWRLLLVGYGYGDVDVQEVVNELRGAYEEKLAGPHWLHLDELHQRAKAKASGLQLVGLKSYEHVVPWLEKLAETIARRQRETPVMQMALALAGHVLEGFSRENQEASKRFDEQDFEGALAMYQEMLRSAARLLETAGEDQEHRRQLETWIARCRLNVGACFICLQRSDEALATLREVARDDLELLSPGQQATLAQGLGLMRDLTAARRVLPSPGAAPQGNERAHVVMVEQLLQILEGEMPDPLQNDPFLELHAAWLKFASGELEAAARLAMGALNGSADPILRCGAIFVLCRCLMDTVWERAGTKQPLPHPREEIVRRLEEGFAELPSLRLPELVRREAEKMQAHFYVQTDDPERQNQAIALLEARHRPPDPIEANIPSDNAPWIHPYVRVSELAAQGEPARAVEQAVELTRIWPHRAPLERFAAIALLRRGRAEEALEHARNAFNELPARGHRLLLARCQLACGRYEETWETLEPLKTSEHRVILHTCAMAARHIPRLVTQARDLLKRYLLLTDDDATARLELARTLFQLGQRRQAAEEAWIAATGPGSDRLDATALHTCAEAQRLEEADDVLTQARVRRIADLLRERFPGDLQAERLRLRLLVVLGLPEEAPAPDWQRLIEAGDVVKATTEQILAVVQHQMDRRATALAAYRTGHLSFEALCKVTNLPAAMHVERFFQEAQTNPGSMSPPIAIGELTPDLQGAHLLVGELELLLLLKLKLLRALRTALGSAGRLLVFNDIVERIHAGVYQHHEQEEAGRLAAELQQAIGAGRGEGWIELLERSRVQDLPPVREDLPMEVQERIAPWREEMVQALAFLEALVDHPERRLLNADYFIDARMGTYPEVTLALAWQSHGAQAAAQFERFMGRLEEPRARVLHLPQIVGAITSSPERRRKIALQLARVGFVDAVTHADLLALSRRPDDFNGTAVQGALDGAERVPRDRMHPEAFVARVRLADVYSRAIWGAFCDETWSHAESESFAGHLLGRAEAIDEVAMGDTLDLTIQFIACLAMTHRKESFVEVGGDTVSLRHESPAGRLWTYLDSWAGPEGGRRAAYGRALRQAWRMADEFGAPNGPARVQVAPLLLPSWHARTIDFTRPELAAPAILSALWSYKPLAQMGVDLKSRQGNSDVPLECEQVLIIGVDTIENRPERAALREDVLTYVLQVPGTDGAVRMYVPPEAVLLRMSSDRFPAFARQLAYLQGRHDGRAYPLLHSSADAPDDRNHRRRYAHMTVAAPWRAVREDPALLGSWRARPSDDGRTFPNRLDDLREMLSEPLGSLPDREAMREVLAARLAEGGAWAERVDRDILFRMACEIPGALSSLAAHSRVSDAASYPQEVTVALRHLRVPNDCPVGRLCADIFFLRLVAARAPIVEVPLAQEEASLARVDGTDQPAREMRLRRIDLREELPPLLATILQVTMESPPPDSLARMEPGLLRLCGDVMQQLSYWPPVPLKDGIWLTHRLYRWLCAQLEALEPDARQAGIRALERVCPPPLDMPQQDVLHPSNAQRESCDLRLASVLLALAYMEDIARVKPGSDADGASREPGSLKSVSSAALESLLLDLAARPLTEEQRRLRRLGLEPSCLDWQGPAAIPDLALTALLKLNVKRFADLPADARLRWIMELPLREGDPDAVNAQLTGHLLIALVQSARDLTAAEQIALEDRLRHMDGSEPARLSRWVLFTELYGAGRLHLANEVRTILEENLHHRAAHAVFFGYLVALSRQAPDRIEPEAERFLAAVQAEGLDPIPFAFSIGGAIYRSDPASIPALQRLLGRLAAQAPFQDDERFLQFLHTLGLQVHS